MVTRRTPVTVKAKLHSTHVLAATVAVLWLSAAGYGHDEVSSSCGMNNFSCQHTCKAFIDTNGLLRHKCVCNLGYQLAEDKHNCDLIDEFLLYSQQFAIKGQVLNNVSEEFIDAIQPLPTSYYGSSGLDFDAHDNYIYYSEVFEKSGIYRIHRNGTGHGEMLLSSQCEHVISIAVDWVAKNVYYIDKNKGTLNVLSTRNVTNRRVLLKNKHFRRIVVHPNKGYIFLSGMGVSRAYMDGSNLINFQHNQLQIWSDGLTVDFVKDRLYWCDPHFNEVFHSNLDLENVMSIKSDSIREPWLLVTYKNWMYIINEDDNKIIKLHKPTGALAKIEVEDLENNGTKLYGMKIYSKHEQPIDNTHPCSIAADYGGCQKLCFAVPSSKKSNTSSLQAVCGCPSDEKVGSGGKTCVPRPAMVRSGGASKRIQYRFVTTFSLLLVYLFTI